MESFRLALHHTFAPGYGQDEALSMDRFPSVFEGIPLCPWIMVKYTKWFLTAPEGKRFAYKLRKAWEGKKKKNGVEILSGKKGQVCSGSSSFPPGEV